MAIVGHILERQRLERMLENDRFSHAFIFTGAPHLGKFTLAKLFADAIIHHKKGLDQGDGEHTDALCTILEPPQEKKKGVVREMPIDVEAIRKVQKRLALFPGGQKKQVLLARKAEVMTRQAQNALLKTLEEPNEDTVIILITENKELLLPTILSRCEIHSFHDVSQDEIVKGFQSTPGFNKDICTLAIGRPGLVVRMLEDKEMAQQRKRLISDWKALQTESIPERLRRGGEYAKHIPEMVVRIELWIEWLRQEARQRPNMVCSNYRAIQILLRGRDVLQNTNVNGRLLIENILLAI